MWKKKKDVNYISHGWLKSFCCIYKWWIDGIILGQVVTKVEFFCDIVSMQRHWKIMAREQIALCIIETFSQILFWKKSNLTKKRKQYFQRKKKHIPRNYICNATLSQNLCVFSAIIDHKLCALVSVLSVIWYKMSLLFIYNPNKANWQLHSGWPICVMSFLLGSYFFRALSNFFNHNLSILRVCMASCDYIIN